MGVSAHQIRSAEALVGQMDEVRVSRRMVVRLNDDNWGAWQRDWIRAACGMAPINF